MEEGGEEVGVGTSRGGEREARRRKLMERGTDRMAFITGRIQSLNGANSSSSFHLPDELNGENNAPDTPLKQKFGVKRGISFIVRSKAESESEPHIFETSTESILATSTEIRRKVQEAFDSASVSQGSEDVKPLQKGRGGHLRFTPKEINSSILASENTRIFCSVITAILVVLSNTQQPRNIVKSKSIVASRPPYVLLLTDVTIVLCRLILGKQGDSENCKEEGKFSMQGDGDNWGRAVKILEMGLVLYQIIRAIFIDCSIYVVIVICGLSLM